MNYKYVLEATNRYRKDIKLMKRRGKNMELLKTIITKLAKGEKLSPANKDHALT
ncbi:type II toxin-antitoxin system YafQ family toxin, partial [Anaerovibrio sp.]|uniref:type II toxin-antitoxin system YafQ family toxin n=1 Tax=Anaerovibrio sp. TaxID=1872532 RepID=UPI003FA445F9